MKYICTVCDFIYDPEIGDPEAESNPEHSLKISLMIGYALCVELEKKISNRIMAKRFINDER